MRRSIARPANGALSAPPGGALFTTTALALGLLPRETRMLRGVEQGLHV